MNNSGGDEDGEEKEEKNKDAEEKEEKEEEGEEAEEKEEGEEKEEKNFAGKSFMGSKKVPYISLFQSIILYFSLWVFFLR